MAWDAALGTKYAILAKQANAADIEARARAGLLDAQTATVSGDSAAKRASEFATAGVANAQAQAIGANSQLAQEAAPTDIMAKRAQAELAGAQTGLAGEQTRQAALGNQAGWDPLYAALAYKHQYGAIDPADMKSVTSSANTGLGAGITRLGGGTSGIITNNTTSVLTDDQKRKQRAGVDALNSGALPTFGFSTGTDRVPGKGKGDTVPAMLTPGEAVLNKEAAEVLGRPAIEALNAIGLAKRGEDTTPHDGPSGGLLRAARGIAKVPASKKRRKGATPALPGAGMPAIDPSVLAAIMGAR